MYQVTAKISVIIGHEHQLEELISQLLAESVARSDISVQGSAAQIEAKYGVSFIDPHVIQDSASPPTQDAFLNDDFGWVVGFSFAIPLFICLILGIFVIGDVRSTSDVFLYGIIGALVGSALGYLAAMTVKKRHDKKLEKQEQSGGFVLWIVTHTKHQTKEVLNILKSHRLNYKKHSME